MAFYLANKSTWRYIDDDMTIRNMIIDDYAAVYRLWQNTPGMGLNTTDDSEEGIAAYLKRNPNTCFVAEKSGEIVGAILSGHDGRRGYIYHVAVEPMIQHGGIGTTLVDRAMDALKNEGIHKVALVVFSNNVGGNVFWEKRGFTSREDLVYRNKGITELTIIKT